MPPLARADATLEKWALLSALGPLICASARAVYPLPAGGATHALLLPAQNRERALRVTPDAEALVQAAALRVAFLQLSTDDGASPRWLMPRGGSACATPIVDAPAAQLLRRRRAMPWWWTFRRRMSTRRTRWLSSRAAGARLAPAIAMPLR